MNDQLKIPLSAKTENLRREIQKLRAMLAALAPSADKLLNDESGDPAKLSEKLGNLDAQKAIIMARLARRKIETLASLLDDARKNQAAAQKAFEAMRDDWRLSREQWKEAVFAAHPKGISETILGNPAMAPFAIRDSRAALDGAREYLTAASRMLVDLDESGWLERRKVAATPVEGWIQPDFAKNAQKYIPELRD